MSALDLHRVGDVGDVPLLEGRSVTVDGRRIAVFRLPDGWAATDAACPHLGGPLQDGIVGDTCVTCPLHQRRFDLVTGRQIGGEDRVAVHEVVELDGELFVRLCDADVDLDAGAGAVRRAA
jgi:nitrite reductase (NADH) small subunit